MKLAILNDTHCGVRNSSDIFIDYQRRFYEDVFFPELKRRGITHIVHLGDYYEHRRYINFKAMSENRRHFLDMLQKYDIKMKIIPGNHDIYYKNSNELNSLVEIMGHHPQVEIIEQPTVIFNTIMLVPWLNNNNYRKFLSEVEATQVPYCMGHFEFKGFDMHRGQPSSSGMSISNFSHFDKVMSGHFHAKSCKQNIHYLGSQFEFTWSDVNDNKYFHIFDTETGELEPVRNPDTMFHLVMYNDRDYDYDSYDVSVLDNKFVHVVVSEKRHVDVYNRFIDRIEARPIHDLTISDPVAVFKGENVDTDTKFLETKDMINDYVDVTQTHLDKAVLKDRLQELYVLAQTEGDKS